MGLHQALIASQRLRIHKVSAATLSASFADEVKNGLSASPKRLAPRFFYDARGSKLFEQITELPEYYLTRCEAKILRRYVHEMIATARQQTILIELGSGSSTKTRIVLETLLDRFDFLHYVPIDVSRTMLLHSARALLAEYPTLRITAYAAEYEAALALIKERLPGNKLLLFLGSGIGNMLPEEARAFLTTVAATMGKDDAALIGFDAQKDAALLEAAYNDAQEVTAAFNLNLLARINGELEADFDLDAFTHSALYNAEEGRIEMHLVSKVEQTVTVPAVEAQFFFKAGESIHTENSYKYTPARIEELARGAGLAVDSTWSDEREYFRLCRLVPA